MPSDCRPRSFLFVPANRPDRFDKAANSGADAIILDLEDSVPAQEKQLARDAVLQWMRTPRIGISVWIRINPLQSQGLLADLRTAVAAKPHGIVLPKCEGADDVHALSSLLSLEEVKLGIDAGTTSVIAIVTETARAMQRINTFDHPIARLYGMLWGAEDLAASLRVRGLRDTHGNYLPPATMARDLALFASRACQALPIDAVFTALDNQQALADEVKAHFSLGFEAKAAIHPAQIQTIHDMLAPSRDDILWAKRVVEVLNDGQLSSARLDGFMVDHPHLQIARTFLAKNLR